MSTNQSDRVVTLTITSSTETLIATCPLCELTAPVTFAMQWTHARGTTTLTGAEDTNEAQHVCPAVSARPSKEKP